MNGRDPDEALVFELLSVYALLVPTFRRVADDPTGGADGNAPSDKIDALQPRILP
jgi:hypothetical protein